MMGAVESGSIVRQLVTRSEIEQEIRRQQFAQLFADCSDNNPLPDLPAYAKAGQNWLARKVTEGTGYRWYGGDAVAETAHELGLLLFHYAWLRPDQNAHDQAEFFIDAVRANVKPGDWLMTDFELTYSARLHDLPNRVKPNIEVPTADQHRLLVSLKDIDASNAEHKQAALRGALLETDAGRAQQLNTFNRTVQKAFPQNRLCTYTGNWYLYRKPQSVAVLKGWPVIMSDYSSEQLPNPYDLDYLAWQFTSSARVPGFSEALDYNHWLKIPPVPARRRRYGGDMFELIRNSKSGHWYLFTAGFVHHVGSKETLAQLRRSALCANKEAISSGKKPGFERTPKHIENLIHSTHGAL